MVRTQVRLTESQMASLRELAAQRELSTSELVRQGVDTVLRSSRGASDQERRRRAIAAAGRFRSGLGDLSERHDDYLGEAFEP